jgi:hypothetical protein
VRLQSFLTKNQRHSISPSGVAGGVVQSRYFQIKFGVRPVEGPANQSLIDNVEGNVVSALQGGAFFGALSSAPVSGVSRVPFQDVQLLRWIVVAMQACFHTWHCLQVLEQFLADGDSSPITNTADLSPARIGRRKTLLAYTVIFAVGAVRCFRFVPSLLGPC